MDIIYTYVRQYYGLKLNYVLAIENIVEKIITDKMIKVFEFGYFV